MPNTPGSNVICASGTNVLRYATPSLTGRIPPFTLKTRVCVVGQVHARTIELETSSTYCQSTASSPNGQTLRFTHRHCFNHLRRERTHSTRPTDTVDSRKPKSDGVNTISIKIVGRIFFIERFTRTVDKLRIVWRIIENLLVVVILWCPENCKRCLPKQRV